MRKTSVYSKNGELKLKPFIDVASDYISSITLYLKGISIGNCNTGFDRFNDEAQKGHYSIGLAISADEKYAFHILRKYSLNEEYEAEVFALNVNAESTCQRISMLPKKIAISKQQFTNGLNNYNYDSTQENLIESIQDPRYRPVQDLESDEISSLPSFGK